jgi:hypothetical protein
MAGQDEHIYGFSKPSADALLQSIGGGKTPGRDRPSMENYRPIVLTPSGGIPKRVGNTVTMVQCDCYYLAGTGSTRTLTATGGPKVWVGNMSTAADVGGDKYVLPTWHGGDLLANWEDC